MATTSRETEAGNAPGAGDDLAEAASRLRLAIARTARRMRQEAGSGLTATQTGALATIERHGPIAPSRLAELERVQRPTATRISSFLESEGLIEREPDPEDGRSCLLTASARGREHLRRLRKRKTAYLARNLHELDAEDLAAVERATAVLERMLDEDRR